MARRFHLANMLPLLVKSLKQGPFAEPQLVPQAHQAMLPVLTDCGQECEAVRPAPIVQRWGDRAAIPDELAPERLGELRHGPPLIDLAWRHATRQQCALIVHKHMECDAREPAHRGLAPGGPARADLVGGKPAIVAHRQGCGVDARHPGAAAVAGGHIAISWHEGSREELHKTGGADQRGQIRPQMALHGLGGGMCARPVVTPGKVDEARHDLAARELRLPGALALARLEQGPVRERGKPLAEIIAIAEQSHALRLAQRNPLVGLLMRG
jgi:hypothetical protein